MKNQKPEQVVSSRVNVPNDPGAGMNFANDTLSRIAHLANTSEALAGLTRERLALLLVAETTLQDPPDPPAMPPYFAEIEAHLFRIQRALFAIEDMLHEAHLPT